MTATTLTTTTRYVTTYIAPGTPFADEPDVDMPVGWHVIGYASATASDVGDPDSAVVVLSVDQAADPEDCDFDEEHLARRLASQLNAETTGYPNHPDGWFARTGGRHGVELCPSCASDGDYGLAQAGREYLCPICIVLWSPDPTGGAVRTRLGNWIQLVKVWATSRRSRTRPRC